MSKILLIRHSEPVLDPASPPSKWQLSDRGKQRAEALGAYLDKSDIDALYCSGEIKAIQTAEIAGAAAPISPVVIPDLREHNREKIAIIGSSEKHRAV